MNDVETAGGGRVVIYADSIVLEGDGPKIEANARPYSDFTKRRYSLSGGSGGYIYVKTTEAISQNSISDGARIEAKGGYAIGDDIQHTSGSGGVVIFDGGFSVAHSNVVVNGGVGPEENNVKGCRNGASGTVYDKQLDQLTVDNRGTPVLSRTVLTIPEERADNSVQGLSEIASNFVVQGQSNVRILGGHTGITFD